MALVATTSSQRERLVAALGQNGFIASLDDGDEASFLILEPYLARLTGLGFELRVEHPCTFVRLAAILPWDTVGYGAAVYMALASASVSAGMLSGFSTDYLLIPENKMPAATQALGLLISLAAQRSSQAATSEKRGRSPARLRYG